MLLAGVVVDLNSTRNAVVDLVVRGVDARALGLAVFNILDEQGLDNIVVDIGEDLVVGVLGDGAIAALGDVAILIDRRYTRKIRL